MDDGGCRKAVRLFYVMHKTINNNKEKPPVCHSRGGGLKNKVESVTEQRREKKKQKIIPS